MPRLHKVIRNKYQLDRKLQDELEESGPLDIDDQNKIIEQFEQSIPLNPQREETEGDKLLIQFLRGVQILLTLINFILIVVPYYRKDHTVLSFLSCASNMLSALLINVEFIHYDTATDPFPSVPNYALMLANIVIGATVMLVRLRNSFQVPQDIVYLLPFVISVGVFSGWYDRKSLESSVQQLKRMRYHYKDA